MNQFVQAIKDLDLPAVERLLDTQPKWLSWAEKDGKNPLHYLCGVEIAKQPDKVGISLQMLKLFLGKGMDINSVHRIEDGGCNIFPATPLWYAYTRGRNEVLYSYLLDNGADPEHCMYAIAWYNDLPAAELFKKYGAKIEIEGATDTPFLGAYNWKRFEIAEWFLQNGANVNAVDPKGNTALYYAVKRKHPDEVIKMLLKFGADMNHENKDGVSPKNLAEANRQRKILKLFGII